jgi:hypothetical protein
MAAIVPQGNHFSECLESLETSYNHVDEIDHKPLDRKTIGAPIDYYHAISKEVDTIKETVTKLTNLVHPNILLKLQKEIDEFHLFFRLENNVFLAGSIVQKELIEPLINKVTILSEHPKEAQSSIDLLEKILKPSFPPPEKEGELEEKTHSPKSTS